MSGHKKIEYDKTCFVIMPFSSPEQYENDHFTKVYEQIFKPAIEKAGLKAYRTDENKICDSIIKKIFDSVQKSAMVLCDLSSKNPNVLYELGLRQAYDKPVVLVSDDQTEKIFDVSGINTVKYSSHRLVENVEAAIEDISAAITETISGEGATVAQIVSVQGAAITEGGALTNDNTNILLKSILADIKTIKQNQELLSDSTAFTPPQKVRNNKFFTTNDIINRDYWTTHINLDNNEKGEKPSGIFIVRCNKGTTNTYIKKILNDLSAKTGFRFSYTKHEDFIEIHVYSDGKDCSSVQSYLLHRFE